MDSIKLEKGIVHLMLPFRFGSEWSPDKDKNENNIWQVANEAPVDLDFLLEYVRVFFLKNCNGEKFDQTACLILKLKKEALPVKMFNNKNLWVSNKPFPDHDKLKNVLKLSVYIDPLSFRIICHPFTRVAILTYSIDLTGTGNKHELPGLDDFIRLNYLLRSFSRHDEAFFISQNERAEERKRALLLLDHAGTDLFNSTSGKDIVSIGWRPGQLINFLLSNLNKEYHVEFFNNYHFVPFSYVQTAEEIKDETTIHKALFYLRKIYDFDYQPAPVNLKDEVEIMQPYKQIFYASCLEGAVIFNNSQPSDPEFIRKFHSSSFPKSQWLFILGLLQRSFFLQLLNDVYEIDPDDHKKVKEYLRRYASISFKAIFSKVSVYHQHNDFYDLIINNFHILELRTEVKDELYELNNMLRQFHEDEVENHEKLEKQYDKRLNMILFALSVLSLMDVTYTIVNGNKLPFFKHLIAIGIPLLVGILVWNVFSFRKQKR